MRYLLDTNVCVRYLNGESVAIRRRLQVVNLEEVAVCSSDSYDLARHAKAFMEAQLESVAQVEQS